MSPTPAPLLTRRAMVRGLVASVATVGGAFGVGGCAEDAGAIPNAWRTPALLDALGVERVRRIGAAWGDAHPDERTATQLRAVLRKRLHLPEPSHDSALADAVSRAIADDFEHDRIVVVDGWLLAVTEARQCALYALGAG